MTTAAERRSIREDALVGIPVPLCDERGTFGPRLLPLTPWHHLLLLGYRNACFCGGPRNLSAVLQYLWLCSPRVRIGAELRFALFAWRWQFAVSEIQRASDGRALRVPTMRAIRAIERHTESIWLDRPALPVAKKKKVRKVEAIEESDGPHELVALELVCRRFLKYTRAEFWHTPYAHTNGLLHVHFGGSAPDAPKFNRARDLAGKQRVAKLRAERAAALARN